MILRIQRQCSLIIIGWWWIMLSCLIVVVHGAHKPSSRQRQHQQQQPPQHHFVVVDEKHRQFLRQSVTQSSTTFGLLRGLRSSSIPMIHLPQDIINRHRDRRKSQNNEDNKARRQDRNNKNRNSKRQKRVIPVAAAVVKERKPNNNNKKKRRHRIKIPNINTTGLSSSTGFFYGLDAKTVEKATTLRASNKKASKPFAMKEALGLTLDELRTMRQEMEALRKEMEVLKRQLAGQEEEEEDGTTRVPPPSAPARMMARSKRQREFDKIGRDVEKWAEKLLFSSDCDSDWTEVQCNKMLQSALNRDGRTRAHIQWLKDSRGENADPNDNREYPCLKMTSTIDAPLDVVCAYLSQKDRLEEYNCLVVNQKDVEEIAPHAKICWSQTPSLLFVKPRDFITYCQHKWLRDGTQVMVNQALDDHADKDKLVQGRAMAYALRGANYMSRDPDDPDNKTRISILAHGKPGVGVPDWACRTAIKSLIPIEPFKFFQKLNESIKRARPTIEEEMERTRQTQGVEMVSATTGRSRQPAGLAQLGYACFWPNGGGFVVNKGSIMTRSSGMSNIGGDSSSNSSIEATPPQPSTTSDSDSASSGKVMEDEDSTLADVPQSQSQEGYSNDDSNDDKESSSSPSTVIESTTLGAENDSQEMDANNDNRASIQSNGEGHYEAVPVGGDGDDTDEPKEADVNDPQS